ncbi:MAG: DUF1572 family protein [Sphingobacteriales bacterium JAD_PAG50586_3]|nr:MAG: DUF1572 family protein [Sphingobacteriales bacterium JAD_PAG50586_3]
MWVVAPGISNSAGNLALHIVGNLNNFIGAVLGNTGYVRNRDAEFTTKDVPREKIIADIGEVIGIVKATISELTNAQLEEIYPEDKWKDPVTVQHLLLHLLTHLSYHVGQVNYHRRLVF